MNNEPVAWMEYIQGEEWEVWFVEPTDLPKGHTYKPLYTHPVKEQELLDEVTKLKWEINHREQDIDALKTKLNDVKYKYDIKTHQHVYTQVYVDELQAEIEMLRQGMKDGFDGLETMTAFSKAQADQITKLKLEWQYMYDRANMESTNEPVAWMDEDENVVFEKCKAYPIPLYTHPVKELTDEEIFAIAIPTEIDGTDEEVLTFARAILRKARND